MRFSRILLTTALVAFGGAALAEGDWHGHGGAHELTAGVTLSDAQKDQIHEIEHAGWTQAKPVVEEIRGIHEQIVNMLLSGNSVTEADLAPLVEHEEALAHQIAQQRITRALQIRQVMTPAQLTEAAAKHQQMTALRQQEHQILQVSSPD